MRGRGTIRAGRAERRRGYSGQLSWDDSRAVTAWARSEGHELKRVAVDGNQMAFFPADERANGTSGALAQGDSYFPGKQGARIYFSVINIDDTLAKAASLGSKVIYPKTSIGDLGWVAEFEDSEGNCIALHSN